MVYLLRQPARGTAKMPGSRTWSDAKFVTVRLYYFQIDGGEHTIRLLIESGYIWILLSAPSH